MKIECGFKEKRLSEIEVGDLFYFDKSIHIKTDANPPYSDKFWYCVDLESGYMDAYGDDVKVGVVENATLKIGGYYK